MRREQEKNEAQYLWRTSIALQFSAILSIDAIDVYLTLFMAVIHPEAYLIRSVVIGI